MRHSRTMLAVSTFLLALVIARPVPATAQAVGSGTDLTPNPTNQPRTDLQKRILASIDTRKAQGLPTPAAVSFSYVPHQAPPVGGAEDGDAAQNQRITVVAKTVIQFDGPEQAGNAEWPALIVQGDLPANAHGTIRPGDYSEMIRQKAAEKLPGIWDLYTFGHEPRTYTFTETFTMDRASIPGGPLSPGTTGFDAPFVMGFSVIGPDLDYTLDWSFEICVPLVGCETVVKFRAGFQLDWGLGLRLPMELGVTSETPYLEGSSYTPTSVAHGLDFAASEYSALGAPAEGGNEAFMRFDFTLGVFLEVFGSDVIDIGVDTHPENSASFATPFGPGQFFPIPALDVPLYDTSITVASLAIGFRLTPHLGSDRFTADWEVTGEASGSGSLTYTDPAVAENVGPVQAIDGPGFANFTLDDLRYYFNEFLLDLDITIHLDVFGVVDENFVIPVTDFDLSVITGGLSVGPHTGTPGSLTGSVAIENVAPTAVIDKSGTTLIHGIQTFLGETGTPLSFSGSSHDPGRDDLTLSWDWGDGAPAPDVVNTFPVPHDVTDTQAHTFDKACLFSIGFRSVDDDLASAEDHVNVLIFSSTRTRARLDGFWQELMAGNGSGEIDSATLDCMLGMIGYLSSVFDEVRDASTMASAYDVLQQKQNGGSAREQLDRELLVTWLNLANGVFGYDEPLDADGDNVADGPFSALIAAAEAVRLNPAATEAALKAQKDRLHKINISRVGKSFAKNVGAGEGSSGDARAAFEGLRVASSPGHSVEIAFALAAAGPARLEIYDVGGRLVRTFDGTRDAGVQSIRWDGSADSGLRAGSGIYFIRATLAGRSFSNKALLLR